MAPARFEQGVELAFLDVRRSFEHQVLEQMREAGASGLLARRADVVPDVDRRERDGVILVQDHVQPVGSVNCVNGTVKRRARCGGGAAGVGAVLCRGGRDRRAGNRERGQQAMLQDRLMRYL